MRVQEHHDEIDTRADETTQHPVVDGKDVLNGGRAGGYKQNVLMTVVWHGKKVFIEYFLFSRNNFSNYMGFSLALAPFSPQWKITLNISR